MVHLRQPWAFWAISAVDRSRRRRDGSLLRGVQGFVLGSFGSLVHQTGGTRSLLLSGPPTGLNLVVLGILFTPEKLRRHFLRAVAGAAIFVLVAAATSASHFLSRHRPAKHRIPDVSASPDVVSRPVVLPSEFSFGYVVQTCVSVSKIEL